MADPQHEEPLDAFDRTTVVVYRSGLALAALALGVTALQDALGHPTKTALWGVSAGVVASVACMHLYDKRIRWVIASSAWTGAVLQIGASLNAGGLQHTVWLAGQGFFFISLSALALKEQFCFRVPLLKAVPLFLAASLVPLTLQTPGAAIPLAVSSLVLTVLAYRKWKMPLHFDIGNRALYQN